MVKRLFLCLMSVLAFVDALSQTPQAIQVSVTKDDTIYIGEYTKSKLYGDYGGQTISNGKTRLNYELVTLEVNIKNKLIGSEDNSGLKFLLHNKRAAVAVNFDRMNTEQELWFCTAYKDTVKGWCANKTGPFIKLRFVKKSHVEATPNQDHSVPVDINTLNRDQHVSWMVGQVKKDKERLDALEAKLESINNNPAEPNSSFVQRETPIIPVFILLLVGAILLYMLIKQNKQQNELKQLSEDKKKLEELLNKKMVGAKTVTPLNATDMTEQKVNDLITRRLNEFQVMLNKQTVIQTDSKKPNVASAPKASTINTDQVVPDFDRKGFRIGNPSEAPIFRIYSKGNDYFYTLVDNEEVLRSLPATIAAFDDFLTYTVAGGNATKACPATPGRLEKVGEFYMVDPANKLKVEFV